MAEPIVATAPSPPAEHRAPEAPEFPGCRPVYISREDIAAYEDRYEFWDADTETAMVCEPTSYYHERPSVRLAGLARTIAQARGSPIEAVGHTDLLVRNERGERQRIMQADQILFLRRQRGESRAEGWVQGRTLGRTEGHAEGRAEGRTEGYAEGEAKGLDEGRKEGTRAAVLQVFESRGIPVSASLPERLAEMGEVSTAALVQAAMACRDEEDFLRLIRRRSPAGSRKDGA